MPDDANDINWDGGRSETTGEELADRRPTFIGAPRARGVQMASFSAVIANDSDAIQTQRQPPSLSLDCFALLAMTSEMIRRALSARPLTALSLLPLREKVARSAG